ncbi:FkbM family methyltransferase [Kamptonema sp. UHCC 0994]|uniref:FkbM family methyltransferase n=1 Tax=Kamptonema sp. UHCC 0994 TaxID=3031329 RepID=UPI0023B94C5D|nr:FkbM family methyltransferase [Kamptonema sp. UHCC 0994]MDF0552044.1 FkbM family methyltransferase [Kamptonema sp. UHCC 0994]
MQDAESLIKTGTSLLEQGNLEEAIAVYEQILQAQPDNELIYLQIAETLSLNNQLDLAISFYQKALPIKSAENSDGKIYDAIASFLFQQKQSDLAIAYYQKASEISPKNSDYYTRMGHLLRQKNIEAAISFYYKAIENPPTHPHAYLALADCLAQQQKLEEAVSSLQELMKTEMYWVYPEAKLKLGIILIQQGKLEDAMNLAREMEKEGHKKDSVQLYLHILNLIPFYYKQELYDIFQRVQYRSPLYWELFHCQVMLMSGISLGQIEKEISVRFDNIARVISERRVLVDCQKFKIYLMRTDLMVGINIWQNEKWEPHVETVVINLLKPGSVFVDIGANIGYYTLLASSLLQNSGKVIAFEPNPLNLQLIYASIVENRFSNITVYPFAVSDSQQILGFSTESSNGNVVSEGNVSAVNNQMFVSAIKGDDLLLQEKQINLIKLDIEYHEPWALRGMDKTIKKHRPIIITEFHRKIVGQEYLEQIKEYGYSLGIIDYDSSIIEASDTDFIMKYDGKGVHLDLIAKPFE